MRFQVETGTRVCTGLDDLGRELIRLRRLAAAAAARLGCRLVASGVAPYRTPGLAAVTGPPPARWQRPRPLAAAGPPLSESAQGGGVRPEQLRSQESISRAALPAGCVLRSHACAYSREWPFLKDREELHPSGCASTCSVTTRTGSALIHDNRIRGRFHLFRPECGSTHSN